MSSSVCSSLPLNHTLPPSRIPPARPPARPPSLPTSLLPSLPPSQPREGEALQKGDEILAVDNECTSEVDIVRMLRGADVVGTTLQVQFRRGTTKMQARDLGYESDVGTRIVLLLLRECY